MHTTASGLTASSTQMLCVTCGNRTNKRSDVGRETTHCHGALPPLRFMVLCGDFGVTVMFLEAGELEAILEQENQYLATLRNRWGTDMLTEKAVHDLRMGKRTELLGDLQAKKEKERCQAIPLEAEPSV